MARRTGSVVKDRSARGGVFRLRYQDATGRRVCETLGLEQDGWTQRRAEQALRERLVDVKRDKLTKSRLLRFGDFAHDAIETYVDAKGRRLTTKNGYLAVVDQHLTPYFGRMQLDAIEPADVDSYIAKKRRGGLSAASVNRHLNVLRRVCQLAVRGGKMRTNPVLHVERLDEPDRRLRWRRLQPEEIGAVALAFDELIADSTIVQRPWVEQARVVFLVIYGLGLRRGEILGLRWRSVRLADPEKRPSLGVENATVRGRDGAPKSVTSRRTLVLDEFLAGELFDHRGRSRYQGDGERVSATRTRDRRWITSGTPRRSVPPSTRLGSPTTSGRSTTAAIRRSRTTPQPGTAASPSCAGLVIRTSG